MSEAAVTSDQYLLWDFLNHRGENEILAWVRKDKLTTGDRAKLNQKLRRLVQIDYDLAINSKLLQGPIYKHVYKLKIHGDVMLRPMLCRGPIDNDAEYTLLHGAVETGGKLPGGSREQAEANRGIVIADQKRRCRHVPIP